VQRTRYARRLSAPLLDRFDLRVKIEEAGTEPGESSDVVAARVRVAVARQRARLHGTPWRRNAQSRPAPWSATSRSTATHATRGSGNVASAGSPGAGRRASGVSRARSPTSRIRPRSRIRRRPRRLDARGPLVSRTAHRWERGENFPIRDADLLDVMVDAKMPRVLLGEGDRATAFEAPEGRDRRYPRRDTDGIADARGDRRVLRRAPASRWSAGSRSASTAPPTGALDAGGLRSASSRPGSTWCTRAATSGCTRGCASKD